MKGKSVFEGAHFDKSQARSLEVQLVSSVHLSFGPAHVLQKTSQL